MITPRIDKMEGVKTPLNAPNLLAIAKFLGICVTTKDRKKKLVGAERLGCWFSWAGDGEGSLGALAGSGQVGCRGGALAIHAGNTHDMILRGASF